MSPNPIRLLLAVSLLLQTQYEPGYPSRHVPDPTRHTHTPILATHFMTDPPFGLQTHIDAIRDPELKKRAALLPSLVSARWTSSTTSKYSAGWSNWEGWCRKHPESCPRPATAFYVALYREIVHTLGHDTSLIH